MGKSQDNNAIVIKSKIYTYLPMPIKYTVAGGDGKGLQISPHINSMFSKFSDASPKHSRVDGKRCDGDDDDDKEEEEEESVLLNSLVLKPCCFNFLAASHPRSFRDGDSSTPTTFLTSFSIRTAIRRRPVLEPIYLLVVFVVVMFNEV